MTKILYIFSLVLFALSSFAQGNADFSTYDVKVGVSYAFELTSLGTPMNVNVPGALDTLHIEPLGGNNYEVVVRVDEMYFGDIELVVEYYAIGDIPGIPYPFYKTYKFRSYLSEVVIQDDIIILDEGVGQINPLYNDSSSDGPLTLDHIAYTVNCEASISDSITIDVAILDIAKEAYIVYLAKDTLNTANEGKVVLISSVGPDELSISLHNKQTSDIYLSSDYEIVSAPQNGTLIEAINNCWRYDPLDDFVGQDSLTLVSNGDTVKVHTQVYNKSVNIQFVNDDEVYVVPGGTVAFNVLDNDLLSFMPIIDYSNDLTYLGSGQFEYTAVDPNFSGDVILYYKVFNGFIFITGNIVIHVDHYSPNVLGVDYKFYTYSDVPLAIEHHAPIDNFSFSIVTNPVEGTAMVVIDSFDGDCDTLNTPNTIVYDPQGFVGNTLFEVEYCTTPDHCEIVKIEVTSLEPTGSEDCACLVDCVWEGDVNKDGVVNSLDIMELAYNIGQNGQQRPSTNNWTAQSATNWNYTQYGSQRDLSHSDTNGDGYVDADDLSIIESNYGYIHGLLPTQSYNILSSPVNLIASQSDVDSGEMVIFYIEIGSFDNPVLDFSGVSFNFNIDPDVIDSASVYMNFYDKSWAGYGNPSVGYYNQTSEGNIDVVFSNIGGGGNSGEGIIAELGFIVEDDVCGLRLSDDYYTFPVSFRNGVIMNSFGKKFSLPHADASVKLNISRDEEPIVQQPIVNTILVGPNPTSNQVTITSSSEILNSVTVFDITGQQLISKSISETSLALSLATLPTGTYIIQVELLEGTISFHKIVKI